MLFVLLSFNDLIRQWFLCEIICLDILGEKRKLTQRLKKECPHAGIEPKTFGTGGKRANHSTVWE